MMLYAAGNFFRPLSHSKNRLAQGEIGRNLNLALFSHRPHPKATFDDAALTGSSCPESSHIPH
jgi:hypothetical protein